MSKKPSYCQTIKNNYQNRLDIGQDSIKAKEIGISYGQYKAGLMPDDVQSDYSVHNGQYLTKKEFTKEKTEKKNTVAAIKIK